MVWVYILECANGSFYTGYTTHPEQRFRRHLAGKVKYTAGFKPVKLGACWQCPIAKRGPALSLEHAIKKLDHEKKRELIKTPYSLPDFIKINTTGWHVDYSMEKLFSDLIAKDQQQS